MAATGPGPCPVPACPRLASTDHGGCADHPEPARSPGPREPYFCARLPGSPVIEPGEPFHAHRDGLALPRVCNGPLLRGAEAVAAEAAYQTLADNAAFELSRRTVEVPDPEADVVAERMGLKPANPPTDRKEA